MKEYKRQNKAQVAINQKRYVQRNRKKVNARVQDWRRRNPAKVKNSQLKVKCGITLKQYNEMLVKQAQRCAICNVHISQLPTALCVDHDHDFGNTRGLLCKPCNLIIGNAQDNTRTLHRAIEYLEKWSK